MEMNKEKTRLKDGRYLIYYTFDTSKEEKRKQENRKIKHEDGKKKKDEDEKERNNQCQN